MQNPTAAVENHKQSSREEMCNTPSWFSGQVKETGATSGTKSVASHHFGGSCLDHAQHLPG